MNDGKEVQKEKKNIQLNHLLANSGPKNRQTLLKNQLTWLIFSNLTNHCRPLLRKYKKFGHWQRWKDAGTIGVIKLNTRLKNYF